MTTKPHRPIPQFVDLVPGVQPSLRYCRYCAINYEHIRIYTQNTHRKSSTWCCMRCETTGHSRPAKGN